MASVLMGERGGDRVFNVVTSFFNRFANVIYRAPSLWPGLGRLKISKRLDHYFWSAPPENMIFGENIKWRKMKLRIYIFFIFRIFFSNNKTSTNKLFRTSFKIKNIFLNGWYIHFKNYRIKKMLSIIQLANKVLSEDN